jgi:uncharacterized YkwD family protein
MKNKIFILFMTLTLVFTTSCAQQNEQVRRQKEQTTKQQSTTQKQQVLAGVESSSFQTGDIKNIKIISDKANIKAGCANNSPVVKSTTKGTNFDVISEVSDWYALKLPDNKIGFVSKKDSKAIVVEDNKTDIPPQSSAAAPQGSTTAKTPAAKTNTSTLTAQEQQMLKLLNDARAQNKLAPLKVDMNLTNVARIKAQDMIDNKYFSHNSPKYGSPFDMMKSFGVKYIQAGENIAGNQTVQNAENALMNSPGHRKNILSPNFTHIGIGIQKGGPYGNMFTQMFISK